MANGSYKWDPVERRLEKAETKVQELEAVIIVAEDALDYARTFYNAVFVDAAVEVSKEWLELMETKLGLALAACKHRRV